MHKSVLPATAVFFFISALLYAEKYYTNGSIISSFPLSELTAEKIFILDNAPLKKAAAVRLDYEKIVINLLQNSNEQAFLFAASNLGIPPDEDYKTRVMEALFPGSDPAVFEQKEIFRSSAPAPVILENADELAYLTIEKDYKNERMVIFKGNISVFFEGKKLCSPLIKINLDEGDIFGEGPASMTSPDVNIICSRFMLNFKNHTGFLFNGRGYLNNIFYDAVLIKLTGEKSYTVEDARIKLDNDPDPVFYLKTSRLYIYDESRILARNIRIYVHEQPFFWFPAWFREPISSGIKTKFGSTVREGYYMLNRYDLLFFGKLKTSLLFDNYQRMGNLLGVLGSYKSKAQDFTLDARGARYKDPDYYLWQSQKIYSTYFNPELEEKISYRYKIDYNHILNFNIFQNRVCYLQAGIKKASDPYFRSDFERELPSFNPAGSFQNIFSSEPDYSYVRRADDLENYKLDFVQQDEDSRLRFNSEWSYKNYQDFRYDETDMRHWKTKLKNSLLPHISFKKAGTIGGQTALSNSSANIQYNAGFSYEHREYYQDESPFAFDRGINNLLINADISRAFDSSKLEQEHNPAPVSAIFTPRFSAGYRKQWGGENKGEEQQIANFRDTYLHFGNSDQMVLYFPGRRLQNKRENSPGRDSMIPFATLALNYNIFIRQNTGKVLRYKFILDQHNLAPSFSLLQYAYGLFYVYHLDFFSRLQAQADYNLMHSEDLASATYRNFRFTTERFNNLNASLYNKLFYKDFFYIENNLTANFLKTAVNPDSAAGNKIIISPELDANNFTIGLKNSLDRPDSWFYVKALGSSCSWQYYFSAENFRNDRISFEYSMIFRFLKYFDLTGYLVSANSKAWLYFAEYKGGGEIKPVNFFSDLGYSLNIFSRKHRSLGNFKFSRAGLNLLHDLDKWELSAQFHVEPKPLPPGTGSVKGYYYDMQFSFEIRLKSFPGFEDLSKQKLPIPQQKYDLSPEIIKNWNK
ncbi:MAG: hypothetical protein A2096_09715 [Spirochaetes bacterium GWF1_41_5]|nr:MAG: hypothetical protein A2096_09715 [Spirochaetes bacterium GWF1_41_5]HBE03000.1 hypothetical protein [Spirochaetia bacterium]